MFGKMKQRDAEDVLGDIAKQDRRINRARQSIAPERVSFVSSFFFLGMFRSRQACCHHAKYKRKLAFALCTSPSMLQRQAHGEACVGHVHIQPLSVVIGLKEPQPFRAYMVVFASPLFLTAVNYHLTVYVLVMCLVFGQRLLCLLSQLVSYDARLCPSRRDGASLRTEVFE